MWGLITDRSFYFEREKNGTPWEDVYREVTYFNAHIRHMTRESGWKTDFRLPRMQSGRQIGWKFE